MPQLENARHERFAQAIASGKCQRDAYFDAGYEAQPHVADVKASQLVRTDKVAARIAELQHRGASTVQVTVAWLLETAQGIITEARAASDFGAASQTLERAAKIAGLWVDQSKVNQTVETYTVDAPLPGKSAEEWQTEATHH